MDPLTRTLLAAQRGDERALERFVRETQGDVMAVCRHLGDPDSAEDLAQETYRRAFASLHRFRADGPAKHWLLVIARRTCADATRRRTRRRRLQRRLTLLGAAEADSSPTETGRAEVQELIDDLDPDRRAAFVLTQITGLRYDEAADVLGVPIGTIRSRVARAREQIVAALEQADGDGEQLGRIRAGREPDRLRRRP